VILGLCPAIIKMNPEKFQVSRDRPSLFITAVAKDRLPVFRTSSIKAITCQALDQARQSCGFLIFAYVVMPDHLHLVTNNPREASVVLRYIKGTTAHELIEHLNGRLQRGVAKTKNGSGA
jgi:REP element-mobilizing transposase RayT